MTDQLAYRFLVRRGTKAELAAVNEVPLLGEMVYETDQGLTDGNYKVKIGDGVTHYNSLKYLSIGSLTLPFTTKGDLLGFDGTTAIRIPGASTTGFVPTWDPSAPSGISWQAQAGSGGGASYDSVVLADSPIGYWKMSDTSGTTCTDSSGNAHHGTYNGGFTLLGVNGPGNLPGGVLLNGSTGFASVAANAAFNLTSPWTVEGWTQLFLASNGACLLTEKFTGTGNPINYSIGINVAGSGTNNNQITGGYYTGSIWMATQGQIPALVQLYHMVCTFDGTTIKVYCNGALMYSFVPASGHVASNDGLLMGVTTAGTGTFLNGILSCCALYGTALSAARVKAHYLAGR